MTPLGPIGPLNVHAPTRTDAPRPLPPAISTGAGAPVHGGGFGQLLDGLVGQVNAQQNAAQATTEKVLLGETDYLHQSVIAMQEASVAFSMMVEVRNKLVESYQELMRMQV